MKSVWVMDSPIGPLILVEQDGALAEIRFGNRPGDGAVCQTPWLQQACRQLSEYFAGNRRMFDLPLNPQGTAFQQQCWRALLDIPYGQTRTYAQQAQAIGKPGACRAVGMGNHFNPLPIVIPCHRVVGKDGSLTGYAGGLEAKRKLLALEGVCLKG